MPFRSSSTNNVSDANLVVTKPSGVVDGDILIAWMISDSNATTFDWVASGNFTEVSVSPPRIDT
jgi:hypothetical protein